MSDPERAQEPDATKLRIVEAAQTELLEHGFDRVSIDAIAARAGTSKTSIYERFASKSALFADVLRLTIAMSGGETLPDVHGRAHSEALQLIGQWLNRSARAPANLALYRANIVAATRYPELSAELHEIRSRAPALIAFIDRLPARASAPDLPSEQLAQWFSVLAIGGLHSLLGVPEDAALDRARIDGAVHLFTGGWRLPVTASKAPLREMSSRPADIPGEPGRTPPARWNALLTHTARSLLDDGVRGTSIARLSSTTGLSKMTIYRRFGDKEGLIGAALHHLADSLAPKLSGTAPEADISTVLLGAGRDYLRRFSHTDHRALLRLMVNEAAHQPELTTRLWQRLAGPSHTALAGMLKARADAGELHVPDPTLAAGQFLLLAGGGNRLLTSARSLTDSEVETHVRQLTAFCLRQPAG